MKTTHHLEWLAMPVEIRRYIEWVENWQDYPPLVAPTIADCRLAAELVAAWEDGCSLAEIQAIWTRSHRPTAA